MNNIHKNIPWLIHLLTSVPVNVFHKYVQKSQNTYVFFEVIFCCFLIFHFELSFWYIFSDPPTPILKQLTGWPDMFENEMAAFSCEVNSSSQFIK